MPELRPIHAKDLLIDPKNYRTTPHDTEIESVHAMLTIAPSQFTALLTSILDDGYTIEQNLFVYEDPEAGGQLIVREGNRRLACLKIIHRLIDRSSLDIPEKLTSRIDLLTEDWLSENASPSCLVFSEAEQEELKKLVGRTHGRDQKAGRHAWESVAKSRFNRDENDQSEPGLDLLEKCLVNDPHISKATAELWSGKYHLTTLDEALVKMAKSLSFKNARELADAYPNISFRSAVETIVRDIGKVEGGLGFAAVRAASFPSNYGIPDPAPPTPAPNPNATEPPPSSSPSIAPTGQTHTLNAVTTPPSQPARNTRGRNITVLPSNPKSVKKLLSKFAPRGNQSLKLAVLVQELKDMNIEKTPHAFCFVMRSLFDIAAKEYSQANGMSLKTENGKANLTLTALLNNIINKMTPAASDFVKAQLLVAKNEINGRDSIFRIDSLNDLIHHPNFSPKSSDISTGFNHVLPLLAEMTK